MVISVSHPFASLALLYNAKKHLTSNNTETYNYKDHSQPDQDWKGLVLCYLFVSWPQHYNTASKAPQNRKITLPSLKLDPYL